MTCWRFSRFLRMKRAKTLSETDGFGVRFFKVFFQVAFTRLIFTVFFSEANVTNLHLLLSLSTSKDVKSNFSVSELIVMHECYSICFYSVIPKPGGILPEKLVGICCPLFKTLNLYMMTRKSAIFPNLKLIAYL